MADWSHGYNISSGYTYNFYRELAPAWIDFSVRLAGKKRALAEKRRYLELGCGQGVGLALLAAANPEMEFVGIDFDPSHIAHATQLAANASLSNVRFIEADFLQLAKNWPQDVGTFDEVVLHGILSWVAPAVRQAIVSCLAEAIRPGGIAYVSYNALPGWLSAFPLQHLLRRYEQAHSLSPVEAIEGGLQMMRKLQVANAGVFQSQPGLDKKLDQAERGDRAYLVHEYLHDGTWHPRWFSQAGAELSAAKLRYIGTATLPDAYLPALLPEGLRTIVNEQTDPMLRMDLIDACINQSFRRDLYQRGEVPCWPAEKLAAWEGAEFLALQEAYQPGFEFDVGFAKLGGETKSYNALLAAMQDVPVTVRKLQSLPEWQGKSLATLLQAIALLMHGNYIAPARTGSNVTAAIEFNRVVARSVCQGAPYNAIACAHLGAGATVSSAHLMMLDVIVELGGEVSTDALAQGLQQRLARFGQGISKDGNVLADADVARAEARRIASAFLAETLPRWKVVGAWA